MVYNAPGDCDVIESQRLKLSASALKLFPLKETSFNLRSITAAA